MSGNIGNINGAQSTINPFLQQEINRSAILSLNVKSKAFTPSYKKGAQSCNGCNKNEQEIISDIKISDLDIMGVTSIATQMINRPKSPIRHQSSSDLHKTENLIGSNQETELQVDDDTENEMLEVLMNSKINLIKYPIDEAQTRTSSRFQHIFDKLDHNHHNSDHHSRKYTGNSNTFENEEGGTSSEDNCSKDIFAMNIAINYVKD